jgi:tetratricopeptide (TPR) repeat protein
LKRCLILNDKSVEVLKYICKNLFFVGRYKASIEVAHDALRLGEDWEIYFTMGQCFLSLKDLQRSLQHFGKAYELSKNEQTFL